VVLPHESEGPALTMGDIRTAKMEHHMFRSTSLIACLIAVLLQLVFSQTAHPDVMIKVRTHVSAPGATSADSHSKGVSTYYLKGEARRNDTISPLGSHTAIIRHCDTGASYFVDFDRKEYYKIAAVGHSEDGYVGQASPSAHGSPKGPEDIVSAETVEVGETKKILGHPARHFITKVSEPVSDPGLADQVATEVIDGWYLMDIQNPPTNCTPLNMMDRPSAWIGAPVLPENGAALQYKHTGPTPKGLAVQVRRSSSTAVLEREVVDLSDATLDPALFEIPSNFKEVARPPSHNARQTYP